MLDSLFEDVVNAINKWRPKKQYSKEPEYRNDLLEFLRTDLNKSSPLSLGMNVRRSVVPEHGRNLCDIGVDRRVGVELKNNLKSKSVVDRLVGQISGYKKDYEDIIVVLVGETDGNALETLKDHITEMNRSSSMNLMSRQRFKVIDKGKREKSSKK